ncbi:hypothetical protein COLO4_01646 [Corchorus olitorius]|uniref:Uncharacterized protein n=1 Tax=Corchorus olitorius TaxID=93759 RepID=A0A1R3L2E5_9ROSI|nr:hypothetical protein COLO4_01646 [Corchorus olitorius]
MSFHDPLRPRDFDKFLFSTPKKYKRHRKSTGGDQEESDQEDSSNGMSTGDVENNMETMWEGYDLNKHIVEFFSDLYSEEAEF